jgi:hypothetical protein
MSPGRPVLDHADLIANAARTLVVDNVTARVVHDLRQVGVEPILLKGPSFAHWLYADDGSRGYGDTDLLIGAGELAAAQTVLDTLGFRPCPSARGMPVPSTAWRSPADGTEVDLHTNIWGWRDVDPLRLRAHTCRLPVASVEVLVLDEAARAVHVATHALQNSFRNEQANQDLARALQLLSDEAWLEASRLARSMGAMEAFTVGLRSQAVGEDLAHRLRLNLSTHLPSEIVMAAEGSLSTGALSLELLVHPAGTQRRLGFLRDRAFPGRDYARDVTGSDPDSAFILAYIRYWRRLASKLPGAVRAWRAAR